MEYKIAAGIVCYNPDSERLIDNIKSIGSQVEIVYLFDNGSIDKSYLTKVELIATNIIVLESAINKGVAAALNELCRVAINSGYHWILTLDQDSVVEKNVINNFVPYMNHEDIAIISPMVIDRNYGKMTSSSNKEFDYIQHAITSCSLLRLSAYSKVVGGFCDKMFIDSVDFDMCYSLSELGFNIIRVNKAFLLHEIGHSTKVKLFGRDEFAFNHSPLRCYYMVRNRILLYKRHHCYRFKDCITIIITRFIIINKYENNKMLKNKMMLKGIIHGLIGHYGKY